MQSRLRKKTGRQEIRFERHGVGGWGNEKVGDKVKKRQKWEWQLYLRLAERLCHYVSPPALLQSDCAVCSFSLRKHAAISCAHTAK